MPFTPFSFDESVGQTEPGRPHVPEGHYLLEAVKVEPTPEDYTKTVGVFLVWKISEAPDDAGGSGVGREFRDYCSLGAGIRNDRGTQFGLGQALGALGLASVAKKLPGTEIKTYDGFKGLCAALTRHSQGKKVVALIADQPGNNGRPFSGIEEYQPAGEWAALKRARVSPMRGPAVATASANGAPAAAPAAASASLGAEIDAMFEGVG